MKIYIRYYRNFVFGNYATLAFDIDPQMMVIDLKRQIFARIRIDPKFQELKVKNHGALETMNDECSLSFYNIKDEAQIFLENIQQKTSESEQIKETVQKISHMNNPRYLQKLGIVRNMINQEAMNAGGATRDQFVVDELCNIIRKGCTLDEFKKGCQELLLEEVKEGEEKKQIEIESEFFATIGSSGWSVLHSACSSNNIEIVEYLIQKKRVNPNLKGKDDWTPLEIVIQSGFFQIANILLEDKRLQINEVNSVDRGSALHLAAKSNYLPICQILLLKNIDLTIKDANGLLAKQVTNSQQIANLIEKYEEQQQKEKVEQIYIDEIKEDAEGEENEDAEEEKAVVVDKIKENKGVIDSSIKAMSGRKLSNDKLIMGTLNINFPSGSPPSQSQIQSPPMSNELQQQHYVMTETVHDREHLQQRNQGARPATTRFQVAFNQRLNQSPKSSMQTGGSLSPKAESIVLTQAPLIQNQKGGSMDSGGLNDLIARPLDSAEQIEQLLTYLRTLKTPYSAMYPLKRVKGTLNKVHRLRINSYPRYIYINPLEGLLISYNNANKFPISPNYVIRLNDILITKLSEEDKWFQKKGNYYFQVKTSSNSPIFYLNNLDLIQFWINEIRLAKSFYDWMKSILDIRYNQNSCSISECSVESAQKYLDKADELINFIMNIQIPEVDMDLFKISMNISAADYAIKKVNEFKSSFFSTSLESSNSNPDQGKNASLEEFSDNDGKVDKNLTKSANEIVYKYDAADASQEQFKKDLETMAKLQEEENNNNPSEESKKESTRAENNRKYLSKSTTVIVEKSTAKLIDDSDKGVGYNSFQLIEILGQGTFGKVFKVKKKNNSEDTAEYAMKVLKKAFLVKNNHLKYAITECNILKQANHPYVIKLHYSFQTPENLYMILDYCPGGDLAFHLNKRQIFDENEARFFMAEVILAMEYIHQLNIIYRDLKPENILIDKDGHVKLADFGLAKEGVGDKGNAKSFCGSPAYLAPEMLQNKGVGKAADVYQIGAVLYELLVGFPPYYTENIKKLYENIKSAKLQIPSYISPQAKDLLQKLLNKNPKQRIGVQDKNEIKKHPFFKNIDWTKLYNREIAPPVYLKMEDEPENDELQYLKQLEKSKFRDTDYHKENKTLNRVKQFTFIRSSEQEE